MLLFEPNPSLDHIGKLIHSIPFNKLRKIVKSSNSNNVNIFYQITTDLINLELIIDFADECIQLIWKNCDNLGYTLKN